MGKILFATDGSASAKAAGVMAASLLKGQSTGKLITLYVSPEALYPFSYGLDEVIQQEETRAFGIAQEAAVSLYQDLNQTTDFRHVTGDPSTAIFELSKAEDVKLIAVGRHGHRGKRMLLGSVSNEVLHEAEVPVLVVPESAKVRSDGPHKILFATDGSASSNAAKAAVAELMQNWPAAVLTIVYVKQSIREMPFDHLADRLIQAETVWAEQLERDLLVDSWPEWAPRITFHTVEGNPAKSISQMAESEDADLIVIGSHGHRSMTDRLLLGRVSHAVVHLSSVPVMVVKEPMIQTSEA